MKALTFNIFPLLCKITLFFSICLLTKHIQISYAKTDHKRIIIPVPEGSFWSPHHPPGVEKFMSPQQAGPYFNVWWRQAALLLLLQVFPICCKLEQSSSCYAFQENSVARVLMRGQEVIWVKRLKSSVSQSGDMSGSGVTSALEKATTTSQALKEQFLCKTVSNNSGYVTVSPWGKLNISWYHCS